MYNEIIPGLYLGNRESTFVADQLGIDHIISIGSKSKSTSGISNTHIGLIMQIFFSQKCKKMA